MKPPTTGGQPAGAPPEGCVVVAPPDGRVDVAWVVVGDVTVDGAVAAVLAVAAVVVALGAVAVVAPEMGGGVSFAPLS
ncbi:MAG TPA: hypothetical protein VFS37_05385 [Conexibacter sp.]|nr:hypothetical protein [Conexibacter sp.]